MTYNTFQIIKTYFLSNSSLRPRPRSGLAWNNKNNDNNDKNNPQLNFVKGTVLGDKEQGVGIRDKG